MNVQDLQTLIDYHYWARDRMLDALAPLTHAQYTRDLGSSFKSIRDTATHTYAAEWAWHERWQGRAVAALVPGDRFADLAELSAAWRQSESAIRMFVGGLADADIDRIIEYKMLNGTTAASPIGRMVQHVVNHASYHRGQITTMLRQIGAPPAKSTDMIAYFRTAQAGTR